jgi:hypothetical protein
VGETKARRTPLGIAALAAMFGALALVLVAPADAFHSKNPSRDDQFNVAEIEDEYEGFDPMETSVPYVAWRGEEVRLVKCYDPAYFTPRENGNPDEGGVILAMEPDETGEWAVVHWSGSAENQFDGPVFFDDHDQQTRVFFPVVGSDQADGGRACFAIDITSHKPGIAVVKLKIDDEGPPNGGGVGDGVPGEGDPVDVHQFNVIWMEFEAPRLRCLEADTSRTDSG